MADLVLIFHFLYVLGIVIPIFLIPVGWVCKWSWVRSRRLRLVHAAMMGFVFFEVLVGMTCPLTILENKFLERANRPTYEGDFIAHWVEKIMYWNLPPWFFVVLYTGVFFAIVTEWFIFPPVKRGQR